MDYKKIFKSLLPHILVIAGFVALSYAYFYPVLEGKDISQHDMMQAKGMSKEIVDYEAKTGHHAMWTNSMFGGMPAYQIAGKVKFNIFAQLSRISRLGLPYSTVAIFFLYLLGFYILFSVLKFKPLLGFLGATAFALSSYNIIIIVAGHVTKGFALGWCAPVIAGAVLLLNRKYIFGFLLTLVSLGIQIYCNHYQITYYLMIAIGIIFIAYGIDYIRKKEYLLLIKSGTLFAIAVGLALLPNLVNFWTTYEYGKYTTRGPSELSDSTGNKTTGLDKDYILNDYSYGIDETMTLLIPNFKGGASTGELGKKSAVYKVFKDNQVPQEQINQYLKSMPLYWGDQRFTSGPVYLGAIMIFLFVLGLVLIKGPLKWGIASASILSIILAWGKNAMWISDFFITYFPAYNKFRTVSMALVIVSFLVPILAVMILQQIIDKKYTKEQVIKGLKIALGITGGITLLFALFGGIFFDFSNANDKQYLPESLIEAVQSDRASLMKADAFRSFIFIMLAATGIFLFIKEKIKSSHLAIALIALVIFDQWTIDRRYLSADQFMSKMQQRQVVQPTEADNFIMQDTTNFRVFNLSVSPFNDATTSYFHKSIGGYHGAKLKRYQELIEHQIGKNNMSVLNMLNTKYFIVQTKDGKGPVPQTNPDALGNAWFVKGYKIVPNADAEMAALDNFNPAQTAIIDQRFASKVAKLDTTIADSGSIIKLVAYAPDDLKYEYQSSTDRLAVFSEIYYDKGWDAFIDGKPADYLRVNYVLRAMVVPTGKHNVEFKFEPRSYYLSNNISFAGSILIIVVLAGGIVWSVRRKKDTEEKA